jgi:hypothetical protein
MKSNYCYTIKLNEFREDVGRFLRGELASDNLDFYLGDLGLDEDVLYRLDVFIIPFVGVNNFNKNNLDLNRIHSIDFEFSADDIGETIRDVYNGIIDELDNYEDIGNDCNEYPQGSISGEVDNNEDLDTNEDLDNGFIVDKEGILYYDRIFLSISEI